MGIWQDVQFAARMLVKDKWFTLVATLALAFGIGVNATVFTFVNAVLLRGLPIDDPERVLVVRMFNRVQSSTSGVSYLDYRDLRDASRSFSGLALHRDATMNVSEQGRSPDRYLGTYLTANGFGLLGQSPALGRGFRPEDDVRGAPVVVILADSVWRNRYGSDPSVIGRAIRVNEVPAIVIGVMPTGFRFPQNSDLWLPTSAIRDLEAQARSDRGFNAFGRLAPGVTAEQAEAELVGISQGLARDYPDTNRDLDADLMTFNESQNGGPLRTVFLSLLGAVGFVLLIACANVANLLLARAGARAREMAVRVSIGASRARLVRQLLIESLLLACISGVLSLAFAFAGIRAFDLATQDVGRPYWIQFTMDASVVAYFAAVCLGTAVLFGLAPALHAARTDVSDALKEGGRSGGAGARVGRWTGALIVGELALTLVLLAGAGFMARNFLASYNFNPGVETAHLLRLSLLLPDAKYPALEQRLAFFRRVEERLDARFDRVALATHAPLQGGFPRQFAIDGQPAPTGQEPPRVMMLAVDPNYVDTVGASVVAGRNFTAADGTVGHEVALINVRLAEMFFRDEDPIGRRIVLTLGPGMGDPPPGVPAVQRVMVVGVLANIRQSGPSAVEADPIAYLPFHAYPRAAAVLLARTTGDPSLLVPALREEMRAVDPDLPLYNIRTLAEEIARGSWPFRVFGSMFAIFAAGALLLSAIGLYAVTAYSVNQRTQEVGVRTALGAQPTQVVWLFMRRALVHLAIGLTIGMAGAFGVGALFESADILVQINGRDPVTIGGIALLLTAVSLAASILPARRATRLDPLVALRGD